MVTPLSSKPHDNTLRVPRRHSREAFVLWDFAAVPKSQVKRQRSTGADIRLSPPSHSRKSNTSRLSCDGFEQPAMNSCPFRTTPTSQQRDNSSSPRRYGDPWRTFVSQAHPKMLVPCHIKLSLKAARAPIASAIRRMSSSSSLRFGPRTTIPQFAP